MPRPKPPIPPQPFPPVPPQPPIVPPPGYNTYVGMRYVPLICGKYDPQRAYEPLSVVAYGFQSFTSLTYVPAGITPDNEQYWALTGDYVAQFSVYKEELNQLEARMETIAGNETEQNNQIANLGKAMETATEAIQNNSERIVDVQKNVTALDAKVDANDNKQTAALNQAKADFAANLNTLTNTVNQNKEATDTAITNLAAELSSDLTDAERDLTNLINSTAQQTKLDYQAADNILSGKIDDLQADTNQKFADQNTKISANTSAIADTKNMVQTLETNTNANFTTVNQKITSAEQEIDALQSKDTAIDSEITLLKSGAADTNAAVSALDSKISQEIVNRTNADTAQVNRINALETAVDDRDNDIDALKQSQQAQDIKISELEENVQINTQDIANLKTGVAAVTSSVAQINASVMALGEEIPKINAAIDVLEDKAVRQQSQITDNSQNIASLDNTVSSHSSSIQQLQNAETMTSAKVTQLQTKVNGHDTKIDTLQDDVEGLTANDNSQNTDISALKLETQRLDAFTQTLESSMNDDEEAINNLQTDYSTLQGRVSTNETDIAALETDVNNQAGEIAGLEGDVTKLLSYRIDGREYYHIHIDRPIPASHENGVKIGNILAHYGYTTTYIGLIDNATIDNGKARLSINIANTLNQDTDHQFLLGHNFETPVFGKLASENGCPTITFFCNQRLIKTSSEQTTANMEVYMNFENIGGTASGNVEAEVYILGIQIPEPISVLPTTDVEANDKTGGFKNP